MTFLHPEFLYYLLPPMFILFGLLLTQKESQAHFFSDHVMDKLRVSANMLTLKARNALFLLTGILLVVALAEPVIKDGTIKVKAKSADIMIALDISDSMLAEDVYPSRIELAKKKALTLLEDAPNERFGIVAFAKNSYLVSPLSFDSGAVAFLLSKLDTSSITQKGTDFLSMLEVVANSQTKSEKKYLLILSDGGDARDFSKEIEYAKEKEIVVFILGVGTQKGAPVKQVDGTYIKYKGDIIISKLNEDISSLATKTGGVYIQNTTSDKDIQTMYEEIQSHSEKKELKSQEIQKYIPLFYYPLGLAMFILLIATSSMSKRVTVNVPNIFLVFVVLGASADLKAGILDFMELDKAKKAYEAGEYEKSAKVYEKYASEHNNGQSYFNAANSYYKQNNYKKALEYYEKAVFDDKYQRAKNFANMGNAYARTNSLEKAKESYEKSLEIKEDKEVRENLEAVKKELDKQKQDKQEQQNNQNKEQNQKENKDQKDQKNNKDQKSQENKNKDSENNSEDKQDKAKQKDKKEESKSQKQQNKEDKKHKNDQQQEKEQASAEIKQMSDAEMKKWIEQLKNKQNTYLYQLNKPQERQNENEKPW
ncbi:VWA domain-containing protein [Sulfurimonas sp.]|uniref:VWA domain-containing protein n=1 Tax=Sulfurimonas sp. TaxID=2022749 RepID=UPI0035614C5C